MDGSVGDSPLDADDALSRSPPPLLADTNEDDMMDWESEVLMGASLDQTSQEQPLQGNRSTGVAQPVHPGSSSPQVWTCPSCGHTWKGADAEEQKRYGILLWSSPPSEGCQPPDTPPLLAAAGLPKKRVRRAPV